MKLKKKALVSLSIAVGVAVLATTAVVGAVNESAYTQLKNAVKTTTARVAAEDGNYTQHFAITLKDNGVVLLRTTTSQKSDGIANEQSSVTETKGGKTQTNYSFNNATKNIWYDAYSDTYFVNEWDSPLAGTTDASGVPYADEKQRLVESTNYNTQDPLAQENIKDLEKILDAFVGNLKDYVSVTENADGSRTFTGSLTDTQIPALVNAIASFATKQYLTSNGMVQPMAGAVDSAGVMIADKTNPDGVVVPITSENQYGLPSLTGDIFVKSVSGTATADSDGVLSGGDLAVVLSGTDADGVAHDLSLQISATMTDIGTTVVTEPDLTGKKVQITKNDPGVVQDKLSAEFIGTYRNDIIAKRDGAFVKIGERTITIESITSETVKGSYTETYVDGESAIPLSFTFEAPNSGYFNINFTYTDGNGTLIGGNMYFDANNASVQFQPMDGGKVVTNSVFPRVFD
jgi:hypothetical protein